MRLILALALVATSLPAAADECMIVGGPEANVDTPVGQYYVDNDDCQPLCVISLWVYEETNGIGGLQRGDRVKDDTCGGRAGVADTVVAEAFVWP